MSAMFRGVKQHENSRMWAYVEWSDENPGHFVLLGGQEFQTKEEAEDYSKGFTPDSYEHNSPGTLIKNIAVKMPADLVSVFKDNEEAILSFVRERHKQIHVRGFKVEQDEFYKHGQLAMGAAAYMIPENELTKAKKIARLLLWPWDRTYWKPTPGDRIKEITKAIAMGMAEIQRLKRLK